MDIMLIPMAVLAATSQERRSRPNLRRTVSSKRDVDSPEATAQTFALVRDPDNAMKEPDDRLGVIT